MRFLVLGLVSLSDGVETVVLPPSKPTSLLAALLLRPNQAVGAEYLQSVVWESSPPLTAKATLQTYVLRLRRLFRNLGVVGSVIETVPGGYRFPATAATLDLVEFRELVAQAARTADPDAELALLRRALALWQGRPLANIRSGPLQRDDLPCLTEDWLRAAERRFDLEIEVGRHREVTAELRTAVREHPGYERFWEQLIESLYRSGRQADALNEYSNVKRYLSEELGIDPGNGLQQLELAILRGEQLPPHVRTTPVRLGIEEPPPLFVGRAAEAEALRSWLLADRPAPLVVISGPPGIGKTALAAHVARSAFPEWGQVVRMSGTDGGPRPAAEVAADLARELSPASSGRRLLVFDDVVGADQLRPLLSADPGGATIVTSRSSLAGLAARRGGIVLRLGPLDPADSLRLLTVALGGRTPADPIVTMAVAEACNHLPEALLIAAARLAAERPADVPAAVAALRADPIGWLAGAPDPGQIDHRHDPIGWPAGPPDLGQIDHRHDRAVRGPGLSMVRRLDAYLSTLDGAVVDAFHAVARMPVGDLSAPEAALEELLDAGLLEIGPGGGYRMYPLLRSYAVARTALLSIGDAQ